MSVCTCPLIWKHNIPIYIYSTARRERSRRQFNPQTGFIVLSLFRPPVAVIDLSSASIFLSREKILQRHVLEDLQSFLYFFFFVVCLFIFFFFLSPSGNDTYLGYHYCSICLVSFDFFHWLTKVEKSLHRYSEWVEILDYNSRRDKLSPNELYRVARRFSAALTDYACSRSKVNRFSLSNRYVIRCTV